MVQVAADIEAAESQNVQVTADVTKAQSGCAAAKFPKADATAMRRKEAAAFATV